MSSTNKKIAAVEQALAQTQCQLCDYADCHAYAKAIVENQASIDRCLPGGETTLNALAQLTDQNPEPLLANMRQQTKPMTLAVIREAECIGCTKCLQACPVDAIIGSAKHMHTVITDVCNGCELCIPPCPVDCIDTVAHPVHDNTLSIASQSAQRYQHHQHRLQQNKAQQRQQYDRAKMRFSTDTLAARKATIQEALKRHQEKKGISHDSGTTKKNLRSTETT